MDKKTLHVLEYPKVLERLAAQCGFSASKELTLSLQPATSLLEIRQRQQEVTEARTLLVTSDATIGGAHDIRPKVELARRGGVLEPADLLDIKSTLIAARELKKQLEKRASDLPRLADIATGLPTPSGLVEAISRTISDRGEVLDGASPKLAALRGEIRVAHERLMSRLQKYISDSATVSMLQDALITQRDGRYVIPLRAEFKGRIKSIVHDQSSSGATLFVEPLAVVELNNKWRELQLAERDEIRRVLAGLCLQIGEQSEALLWGVEALALLDFSFARAKYAEEIRASEPIFIEKVESKPASKKTATDTPQPEREYFPIINLVHARHPLLAPATVVATDFTIPEGVRAVIITGPNTGGKTVALKTVGLLILMAQSGLHIPAQSGSSLSLFKTILADIGDEQSIEQSLSTFSGHITNIIRVLKTADEDALVILDELGAGTDPQEGAALARAILAHLMERRITTIVSTHHPELKAYAHSAPGIVNASVEFDLRTLRPTFQLTIGIPGRSNAIAIAQRLGLPDSILAAARSEINPEALRADNMLDDIKRQRNLAHKERQKAEKARAEAHKLRRQLDERLEKIEDERREVLAQARAEGELEVEILKRNLNALKRQMSKVKQPLEALEKLEEKLEDAEEQISAPVERKTREKKKAPEVFSPLKLGEKVILRTLGSQGIVTALSENEAEVQIGSLRVRAKLVDIQRKTEPEAPADGPTPPAKSISKSKESGKSVSALLTASPGMELDLRGMMAEDALAQLDNYLDQAYLVGMPFVRIIHGKGTGKLRQEVRAALKNNPQVAAFEIGLEGEGGDGVTVAKLVKD
ncbi:MAG: endonuclease MutS2 [Anaerolineales bacterium]|jgi:DNA mismatch repair protein MutS2|nr:endonuclease MutS2 [Anaerolineales bacterium]